MPGNINFNAPVNYPYTTDAYYSNILAGDLDGDSRMDLMISSSYGDTLYVLKNISGETFTKSFCVSSSNIFLTAEATGSSYQWQVNTGNGFNNISDNNNYLGTNINTLTFHNVPSSWSRYQYRCVIDSNNGSVYNLKFINIWTGTINSAWENPYNWSCGVVPDANTDVIINSGTIVLSSNASVKSLIINPSSVFTIKNPFTLTITN